jgi:hypothetical protein
MYTVLWLHRPLLEAKEQERVALCGFCIGHGLKETLSRTRDHSEYNPEDLFFG